MTDTFEWKTFNHVLSVQQQRNDVVTEVKGAAITNEDLPEIIDGKPGKPAKQCPFTFCSTGERIFQSWINIGLVPFIR